MLNYWYATHFRIGIRVWNIIFDLNLESQTFFSNYSNRVVNAILLKPVLLVRTRRHDKLRHGPFWEWAPMLIKGVKLLLNYFLNTTEDHKTEKAIYEKFDIDRNSVSVRAIPIYCQTNNWDNCPCDIDDRNPIAIACQFRPSLWEHKTREIVTETQSESSSDIISIKQGVMRAWMCMHANRMINKPKFILHYSKESISSDK